MAYNSSKGPQTHGDIKFEGDPLETQIDFENDFIALKASGSQVLIVSGTHVGVMTPSPAAHPSGKNDFVIGNQQGHRGATIASGPTSISTLRFTYATAANNGEGWIDYSNNSKKMRFGTNGLNTRMTISDTDISSSLTISASAFYADGVVLGTGMSSFTLAGDGGSSQAITNGNTLTVAGGTGLSSTAGATDTVTVKLDDTTVSAGSYTYSAITVDAQGRLTAASSGTGPAITTYSNAADNRVVTSVNATSVQGEAGLTYNGSILAATGEVSASLGVTGSSLRTATTVIDATHVSSSLNISGSKFYGDGSTLSGVGAGTMSSWTLSADGGSNQTIENGNTVDIAGGTGITTAASATDTVTVNLDDTSVSAGSYTYSAITVDAQGRLTAAANGTAPSITTLNSAGANRVLTSDGGASATAEAGLTYNGSILAATGEVSASLGVTGSSIRTATTVIDATHVSSSLNISGSKFYGDGSTLSGVGAGTMSSWTLSADGGSNQAITEGNTVDIAGGTGITTAASATDTVTVNLDDTTVSAGSYTYSAITVDAQGRLTAASNGAAPSITTYSNAADNRVITSVDSTSVQGEAGLTYNGSILAAAGEISASLGVTGSTLNTATTVVDSLHVSSSLNVSGNALYAGGAGMLEIHKSDGGHAQIRTISNHLQIRNKANNKDIRLQLGEDAGATSVLVRNNSSATVASIDSSGKTTLYNHLVFNDPTTLSANTGRGEVVYYGSEHGTDTLAAGKLMYLSGSTTGSFWRYADADSDLSSGPVQLGIALGNAVSDGLLIKGYFHVGTLGDSSTFVTGGTCYVGLAAGTISFTRPSAVGDVIRAIGHGIAAEKIIYFSPSYDWFQL